MVENKANKEKINPAFHPYEIIRKVLLPYWPIYVVTLIMGYFFADFKVKQQENVYQVNASLIVRDNSEGNAVLSILSTSGPKNAVDNEIQILKSNYVFGEAVKRMDAYTRVVLQGDLTKAEMSYDLPVRFRVNDIDSFSGYISTSFKVNPELDSITIGAKTYALHSQDVKINGKKIKLIADKERLNALNTEYKYSLEVFDLNIAINRLKSSFLAVGAGENSSVINVSMTGGNVQNVQKILNEILDIHTSYSVVEKRRSAQYSLNFIDERLRLINADLDSLEGKIEQFKIENGGVDVSTQASQYLGKVSQADNEIAAIDLQLSILMDVENYIRDNWHSENIIPSTMGLTEPMLTRLLGELYGLESQLDKRIKIAGEGDESVINLKEDISRAKNNLFETIKNTRANLNRKKSIYLSRLNENRDDLIDIPAKQRRLIDVDRQREIINQIYTLLLKKREESAIAYAATISDTRIFQKAGGGIKIAPKPKKTFVLYMAFSLILPILLVYWRVLLNPRIQFKDDITYLTDVPIIGEIMHDKQKRKIIIGLKDRGVASEMMRTIRTKVSNAIRGKSRNESRTIAVSSSLPGEGKTFFSVNMGISYSLTGKKVVLIGADMRKPTLHKPFRIVSRTGLSSYLSGVSDLDSAIFPTEYDGLFVMPAGVIPPNPTELFEGERMQHLMNELKEKFDVVIFDTPPLGLVSDPELIAPYVDLNIFMIRQGKTFKDAVVEVINKADNSGLFNNMALMFNGVKAKGIGKYSYYGYGYYSGYGYGGYGYYGSGVGKTGYGYYLKKLFGRAK